MNLEKFKNLKSGPTKFSRLRTCTFENKLTK